MISAISAISGGVIGVTIVVQEALTLEYYEREIERARAQFESKLFTVQC